MKLSNRKNMILLAILLVAILIMGIGYASIESITGDIEGTAVAKVQEDVFITDVAYVSDVNASVSNSRINNFVGTMMNSTIQLSEEDVNSSITYKVTVYNKGEEVAIFKEVLYGDEFYDNTDITFEITGFTPGEKIQPNESKDIIITFKYNGTEVPSNTVLNSYLNFKITSPNRMVAATDSYSIGKYLKGTIIKGKIETISFKMGKKSDIPVNIESFDASEKQDESIIGYYTDENNDGMYDLIFISEEPIYANKDASFLFCWLDKLKSIDFSNFGTDGVTSMNDMFYCCRSLTDLDVSGFDTSQVINMKDMFYCCDSLTDLNVSQFNTSNVRYMDYMFYNCGSLTDLDISGFDTSKVTNMRDMFHNCSQLTNLNVKGLDTTNVTNMSYMFYQCNKLTNLNIDGLDTSNVRYMHYMFYKCNSLLSLDTSGLDTSKVTNMSYMFNGCNGLPSLDISTLDTSKVTDMSCMFYECTNLTTIYVSEYDSTTEKGWTTANVTDSSDMFKSCTKLVGGNGTVYDSTHIDATYARIDKAENPGYLTKKE